MKAINVSPTRFPSLARATLVLIPLLGIHEVVFNLVTDDYMDMKQRDVRNFINMILSSTQVE